LTLIGELFNMERFSSFEKLCAYVGFIPRSKSSGERDIKAGMVSRGNKRILTYREDQNVCIPTCKGTFFSEGVIEAEGGDQPLACRV
jgi:hypothetical protein